MGSRLRKVSELPILGWATIQESRSLLNYLRDELGFRNLIIAGGSQGGLHAAMAGSLTRFPVGIASWIAPPSAIDPFVRGLFSYACDWSSLSSDETKDAIEAFHSSAMDDILHEMPVKEVDLSTVQKLCSFLSVTNIHNFPTPILPQAAIFAIATEDEYLGPVKEQWENLSRKWEGSRIQSVPAGHISGMLFETEAFQNLIENVAAELHASNGM